MVSGLTFFSCVGAPFSRLVYMNTDVNLYVYPPPLSISIYRSILFYINLSIYKSLYIYKYICTFLVSGLTFFSCLGAPSSRLVCTYKYIYIYMHIDISISITVSLYIYIYIYIYIHTCIYVYIYRKSDIYIFTFLVSGLTFFSCFGAPSSRPVSPSASFLKTETQFTGLFP